MKDFVEFLKLPPNILSALSVASGAMLLLPDEIITKLYMMNFRDKYGFLLGIIFMVSTSILIILLITKIYNYFHNKKTSKELVKSQTKYLKNITQEKVEIIRAFINNPTHTLILPLNDGLVIELQHLQIITPAGQNHLVDMLNPEIKFFLQPWVIGRISNDEELREKFY